MVKLAERMELEHRGLQKNQNYEIFDVNQRSEDNPTQDSTSSSGKSVKSEKVMVDAETQCSVLQYASPVPLPVLIVPTKETETSNKALSN